MGFMEKAGDQIVLKKSHKYYAQVQGQMACVGFERSYFVVWDPVSTVPHIEVVMFDKRFWDDVVTSLNIFFKQFVLEHLLGIAAVSLCAICGKHCLEENEMKSDTEASFKCRLCEATFHNKCCSNISLVCEGCTLSDLQSILWRSKLCLTLKLF